MRSAREAAGADPAGAITLEAEAILDYESIFPPTPFTIDLRQLQASVASADNQYGQLLGSQLGASGSVRSALASIGQPEVLRVQIMLEGAGAHGSIRWERIALPQRAGDPLAIRRDTPFSRFAAVELPQEIAPEDSRFHLLVAIAGPLADEASRFEVSPIDAGSECVAIVDACSDLLQNGQMEITLLPGKSGLPAGIREKLADARVKIVDGFTSAERVASQLDEVDGLHIIAHGRQGKRFNLILEDENLGMLAYPDEQLIKQWRPDQLRLIFLQSCQSAAARSANDPRPGLNSFMQQLVRGGARAVVAMQDFIRMEDAREFSRGFYTSLIREGFVDEAANNGRRRLAQSVDAAWSIPAVTTRLKGGAIWRESPLRAAQKKLRDRVHLERAIRSYPLFPIDVATVLSRDLMKRSTLPGRDEIETVYPPGEGVRVDAFRTLKESVAQPQTGQTICIVGAHGRAKTTLLESLYLSEVERHWRGEQPAIPVMLRLADCTHGGFNAERTFASGIAKFFESRCGAVLDPMYLLNCFDQQPFLFLLSGDEDVSDAMQQKALDALASFRQGRRKNGSDTHKYVVTLDQSAIKVADVPEDSLCLIIQPMSVERVTTYLREFRATPQGSVPGKVLLERLDGVWDLAEVPWLLSEMIDQADRGVLGNTRAEILKRVADERITQVTGPVGLRTRVEDVLCKLAWDMYSGRTTNLAGTDVFELLMRMRGNRDYSLVDFRSQLIHPCRIMTPGDEDGLRFAYPGFRSYFCALYIYRKPAAERERILEEITATLGRRARAQLWEEVLLILAGLWGETNTLLRMILSGVALSDGDQIYIAARCLQEAKQAFPSGSLDDPLVRSIVGALIYRSQPRSLRSVSARRKAIQFLGPLKEPRALPHLIALALKKMRPDTKGKLTYDFSGVRLSAIKALLHTPDTVLEYVRTEREWKDNVALHDTLDAWLKFDPERLCARLKDSDDIAVSSLA
ncbi:MAG TPA: CHAT domain-containing protein, partial [Bryobacteraceae bacterium]|nr:CHAT domain-containing protein [Bryobacteraceae bacterium]